MPRSNCQSNITQGKTWIIDDVYLELLLGVGLSISEDLWSELNISSLVHTVHVSEGRSDGEHGVGDGRERLVDLPGR